MEEKHSNYLNYLNKQVPILSVDYSLAPRASYPRALEEVFFLLLKKHFFEEKIFPPRRALEEVKFPVKHTFHQKCNSGTWKGCIFYQTYFCKTTFPPIFFIKKDKIIFGFKNIWHEYLDF